MADNYRSLKEFTLGSYQEASLLNPADPNNSTSQEERATKQTTNRLEDHASPPIFLKRNLKAMRKARGADLSKHIQNSMEM